MATGFPHLQLANRGTFTPKFPGGPRENAEVEEAKANPAAHSARLLREFDGMRQQDTELYAQRVAADLPLIPAERGFLIRLPEGGDMDALAHALGVELVAETDEGIMLVSSTDLEYSKIYQVLEKFGASKGNMVTGSSLLDVYTQRDDPRKLGAILSDEIEWPLADDKIYTFDLAIQTAPSTRTIEWPTIKRRQSETDEEFRVRKERERQAAHYRALDEWQEKAEERVRQLQPILTHYGGEDLSGIVTQHGVEMESGMVFPDSVQIRVRMSGAGFKDIILNFPHLFEISLPPDLQHITPGSTEDGPSIEPDILPPSEDAPVVCVIDSGIQEEHRWLRPAIDSSTSRCFLPGSDPNNVADYVCPQGHGTRVAGAVLYPTEIPKEGTVTPVCWIQNARVLDRDKWLPVNLPPEVYLQKVVEHFHAEPRFTKIFNHSINSRFPCPRRRMTSWAAKIDELSHEHDVLFIVSAGNQDRLGNGDLANPGLASHLTAGRIPPAHQLEDSMRVANPAQSLHALTVGSVSAEVYNDGDRRSFANERFQPSGFSRTGFGQPWSVIKPDVVEVGGDLVYSKHSFIVGYHSAVSAELLNSTFQGCPAFSKDQAGTSFAAPKVAHIAAHLQSLFPGASPLLYRALIAQSARWPEWTENVPAKGDVLRLIGYGLPSLERATSNSPTRVTLITPDAQTIFCKQFHIYTIRIPQEIRNAALEARIRIDVTLAYTAMPRRTRARRTGYLETWLDWEASRPGESAQRFLTRMQHGGKGQGDNFRWMISSRSDWGEAKGTARHNGTLQKDWAVMNSYELPSEFSIAVRAHPGWNHREEAGAARYCLAVSFEALDLELPVYSSIRAVNVVETEVENRVEVP